jgi:hypothetical protein
MVVDKEAEPNSNPTSAEAVNDAAKVVSSVEEVS